MAAEEMYPKAFISYAWENDEHRGWVRDLATRLRKAGVEVQLDCWDVAPGDQLPAFMERAVRENDYALIICTPRYKEKSDSRTGGVGYEGDIMTAEVLAGRSDRKFIPILRKGSWREAAPSWLAGKYYIDLTGDPYSETHWQDLLATLHNARETPPPIGPRPQFRGRTGPPSPASFRQTLQPQDSTEPIRITGIIVDEIGRPRNDGTPGSALYAVPFRLSRTPSHAWAELFVATWDRPPSWTSMHRPGIARVSGDKVILDGTTVEEVEKVHRTTLKVVVDRVNELITEMEDESRRIAERERQQREEHDRAVRDAASRISFDG